MDGVQSVRASRECEGEMSLQKPLEAPGNGLVIGEFRDMPDCQRTADGESEGTLGDSFLCEAVALPRAILALKARIDGVNTCPTTLWRASHLKELFSLGVREDTCATGIGRAPVIYAGAVDPMKVHIRRLDWVPPSGLL